MAWPRVKTPPEWGVRPVPPEERKLGTLDIAVLWSSLGVGLLVLAAGSLLVNLHGLSLAEVILVSAAGSVVGSLMLAAAARHGSLHGVPTMVSLRPILGRRGSALPSALNALQLLGWAAFELLVMGLAASALLGPTNLPLTASVLIPVAGLLVLGLAWLGPLRVVRMWLERFAFWIMLATTVLIALSLAAQPRDLWARYNSRSFEGLPSLLLALDLVIVMPISWWPLVADYNRFARSGKASALGTSVGFSSANTSFYVLGAGLSIYVWADPLVAFAGWGDPLGALLQLSIGSVVLLIILADETDNAFANVYSTAVSVQNVAPRWRQFRLLILATAAATAGALLLDARNEGLGGGYELFLIAIGGIFVPLLGVVVADSFVVRRAGYRPEEFADAAPLWQPGALVAWAAGTLLYFAVNREWFPEFPPVGATLPAFALAAAVHLILSRPTRLRSASTEGPAPPPPPPA